MWLWPIMTLYALVMLRSQATSLTGNSTKMYYADLVMDNGTLQNIMDNLTRLFPLDLYIGTTHVVVTYTNITTTCDIRGEKSYCQCSAQYDWDSSVCDVYPGCCNQLQCTTNASLSAPVCLPKSKVTVTGSLTLGLLYTTDLSDPTSSYYKTMVQQVQANLSQIYSQCSGFDSLTITGFRSGSVIVDFQMIVNIPLNSTQFANMTSTLEANLNGSLTVTTVGMVTYQAPVGPLCYNANQNLECVFADTTFGNCSWTLSQGNSTVNIVNGTEVTLISPCTLTLLKTSRLWRGNYTCSFSKGPLSHKAIIDVDIALLPEQIQISNSPQYPDCNATKNTIELPVSCAIQNSTENYNVTWNTTGCSIRKTFSDVVNTLFSLRMSNVTVSINCSNSDVNPTVTCTYINRKSQVANATLTIPVIYAGTIVCTADSIWPKAKSNTTAILPCPASIPAVGSWTRNCFANGTWDQLQSTCVNLQLYNLLQDALDLAKGHGDYVTAAFSIFDSLKNSTDNSSTINTHENINASVNILWIVGNASKPNVMLNDSILPTLLPSASNLLEDSLHAVWAPKNTSNVSAYLSVLYLQSMEKLIQTVQLNSSSTSGDNTHKYPNVQLTSCSGICNNTVFNVSVSTPGQTSGNLNIIGYRTLDNLLPKDDKMNLNSIVMSTMFQNNVTTLTKEIAITFSLISGRLQDYEMDCVFWNFITMTWSSEGCYWNKTSSKDQMICICNHLTSFSTLMSKSPIVLPYLDEITYVGLAASISSLIVCLIIEFMVWNTVVKSSVSHFRHTALVNISLCLLMGDSVFLVNSFYENQKWCCTFTVIKHFFYLSMFFWMLCLSTMLLHQLIFVFHQMRKKVYLTISISIGYVCPLIIVLLTYKIYNDGAENVYYNARSCWLNYISPFNGSIHAFIFPVLTIVFINFFSMMVVITKLLRPQVSEGSKGDQKEMAKSILKAIVFLTPIFGVTWILGFFVLVLDLTEGFWAYFVNYAFTIINSLQGLLILLTGCFGEKKVRDALLQRFTSSTTNPSKNENSTKGSSFKK
ncbi:adhesion G-protein coupled receptor F3 [Brienomyrus brachyistius]|uniref:adhesion G-protein coupled receptor F3 n=1 Tax=Brienomyrus brachyistius TaxID=42636 RepID=UPI0020B21E47|nr:adhesion G-protein coupled receptor F3 [Brienomyrus brachyistius]